MTSTAKTVLGIVPGMMALGIVGKTIPNVNSFGMKPKKGKKKKPSILPKGFMPAIVGIPLIGATATQVNALS